jgi:hypothetical protein
MKAGTAVQFDLDRTKILPFHSTFLVPTEQKTDPLCSSFLFEPDMGTEPFHDVGMEPFHFVPPDSRTEHILSGSECTPNLVVPTETEAHKKSIYHTLKLLCKTGPAKSEAVREALK